MNGGMPTPGGMSGGMPPPPPMPSNIGGVPVMGMSPNGMPNGVVSAIAAERTEGKLKFAAIGMGVVLVVVVIALFWALAQYQGARNDIDAELEAAREVARTEQKAESEAACKELMNSPFSLITGPSEYGSLKVQYPKTWSVFIQEAAARGGDYRVFFHPKVIRPIRDEERFALRLIIYDDRNRYEGFENEYRGLVEDRKLTVSDWSKTTTDGYNATGLRFDGQFNDELKGSVLIFRIRDKTVWLRTDSQEFLGEFNEIIDKIDFYSS